MRPHLSTGTLMMPKSSLRAPRARRLTALLAVTLLTASACAEDSGGGKGSSTIASVSIVTLPNSQSMLQILRTDTRTMMGVPTNSSGNWIDKPVTWSISPSGSTTAFTISATGAFAAVTSGRGWLRASSGGRTDSIEVVVRFPVTTVNVLPVAATPDTIRREGARILSAVTLDGDTPQATVTGRTVTWTSSDPTIATVSATGVVTGSPTNQGTVTITATVANALDGGVAAMGTRQITIFGEPAVASVVMTGGGFVGHTSGTVTPTSSPRSGAGNVVAGVTPTWSSTNTAIATVNATTGVVTFVGTTTAIGSVDISATYPSFVGATTTAKGTVTYEVARTLANGAAFTVPAMAGGSGYSMAFDGTGIASFAVNSSGGTGDGDLYVFAPGVANWAANDNGGANFVCRSWLSGNAETCSIAAAVAGWYRIRTHAWTPAGAVTGMTVTLTHP